MNNKVILPLHCIDPSKGIYNGKIYHIGRKYHQRTSAVSVIKCKYKKVPSLFRFYGRWETIDINGTTDKYFLPTEPTSSLPILRYWCVDNQEAIKDLLRKYNVTVQELKKNVFKEEKFYLLLEEIIYNSKKKVGGKRIEFE